MPWANIGRTFSRSSDRFPGSMGLLKRADRPRPFMSVREIVTVGFRSCVTSGRFSRVRESEEGAEIGLRWDLTLYLGTGCRLLFGRRLDYERQEKDRDLQRRVRSV